MTPAIELKQLSRRFGSQAAVDGLDLIVPEGSIYAFLGPNGAGKTTTIKMLLNIVRPTGGEAFILGQKSEDLSPETLAQIGYVSENQKLPEWMTVRQMIEFCRPMYPTWDVAFCDRLVAEFELPLDRKLKNLSRGMKTKAALVCSLAYHPKLLVLDEPFSGLDPLVRDEVIRGMLELTEQAKWTVFISSHDIDEVERLADQVGIINAGKIQLSEPVEKLQQRFRRVEFVPPGEPKLPAQCPASWIQPEVAGHLIRFTETEFDPVKSPERVTSLFPGASEISFSELSLREVFITLAKTYRLKA